MLLIYIPATPAGLSVTDWARRYIGSPFIRPGGNKAGDRSP